MRIIAAAFCACLLTPAFPQAVPKNNEWPLYGRDSGGSRYSPLTQINTSNVSRLRRAWTYHTGEKGRAFETTPIFVDNVLYFSTQNQNIVALDPETGKEIWRFDPHSNGREQRGVTFWPGQGGAPPRIIFGTGDGRLMEIDAKTGKPVNSFGDNGAINLRAGVADDYPKAPYAVSSPPSLYHNVIIVDPSTQESPTRGPKADVRAFDVQTGKPLWTFHLVPRPGEPGNDTWGGPDGWKDRAGPSQWGPATVDLERGMVFVPVGNPADSFYGADRKGTNLYANSIVALDALTGKLRWYFQMVHHDTWDYDDDSPPALIEVKRDGKTIPALAEITKMGLLFILDRTTGKPVFGVEERPVPQTDLPGEQLWPTQPFPLKPPPLARMSLTKDQLTTRTPEAHSFCEEWFSRLRQQGPYTPWGTTASLLMPGTMGGGNWGGVSFDPQLGYIFVNTSSLGGVGQMVKAAAGAPMPYKNTGGYTRFLDQDQYPCQQPPWGELTAINANTGDIVWRRPLGSYDEVEAQGLKDAGASNMGGTIVTAGGLVFVAATTDSKFRAFDSRTGKELWMTRLEATGDTIPMTFQARNGQQYVVVAAGGTNRFRMIAKTADTTADVLVGFSLSGTDTNEGPAQTTRSSPAVASAQGAPAASLPDAAGKDTVVRTCTKCHGAEVFSNLRMTRSAWQDEVTAMIERGAVATDQEKTQIVNYLAAQFPQNGAK